MYLARNEVQVKLISLADISKNKHLLIELLEDNYKINFPSINNLSQFAITSYEEMIRYKQENSAILIGAFEEETVIGFLWAYKRLVLGENRIHIGHIVVNSSFRSAGIGTKLLKGLENFAKLEGIKKIELMTTAENENTMKFYMLNGFSTVRVQLEKELGEVDDNR